MMCVYSSICFIIWRRNYTRDFWFKSRQSILNAGGIYKRIKVAQLLRAWQRNPAGTVAFEEEDRIGGASFTRLSKWGLMSHWDHPVIFYRWLYTNYGEFDLFASFLWNLLWSICVSFLTDYYPLFWLFTMMHNDITSPREHFIKNKIKPFISI